MIDEGLRSSREVPMKNVTPIFLVIAILLFTCPLVYAEPKILDLSNGNVISFSEMMTDLNKAGYIFLAEDVIAIEHELPRMEIIKVLHQKNPKIAIGVEMFREGNQYVLDQWSNGEITKRQFVDKFDANWGEWNRYSRFFDYIRDEKIKLAGLNISKDILLQVEKEGFESLTGEQLGDLKGISCDVKPGYQEVMRRNNLYRGMMQRQAFNNWCEMKILGNITMARNLEKFHNKHPDLTVVVVAGNAHSWKHGIPKQLSNPVAGTAKAVLFEAEGRVTRNTVTVEEADYLWLDYGPAGWRPE